MSARMRKEKRRRRGFARCRVMFKKRPPPRMCREDPDAIRSRCHHPAAHSGTARRWWWCRARSLLFLRAMKYSWEIGASFFLSPIGNVNVGVGNAMTYCTLLCLNNTHCYTTDSSKNGMELGKILFNKMSRHDRINNVTLPCLFFYLFIYRIEDRKTLVHDQRRSLENRTSTDYCPADWFGRLWMWRHNDRCRRYTQCSRRSLHCPTTPVRN